MDLTGIREEYLRVLNELSNPDIISDRQKFQELSRSKARLEKIIRKADEIEDVAQRIEENQQILSSREDRGLSTLAEQELQGLVRQRAELQKELENLSHEKEERAALIMEIRPGTGGEEAALFAASLLRMYTRFAERKHWSCKLLNMNETELGGVREAALEIEGKGAFAALQHEAGVHRVQRIPATEKAGRVHTSTASVAILPKPEAAELVLRPDELEIDFYRSSGAGGQNVNKRETAVRITHKPTGIVVTSQTARTQPENKEYAMALLSARVLEKQRGEKTGAIARARRGQIGKAMRAEKIRTYNFPQDRLTDHRIKKTWHNLEQIMAGNLDPIFDSFIITPKKKM